MMQYISSELLPPWKDGGTSGPSSTRSSAVRVSSATLGVETRSFGCGLDAVQRFVLSDVLGAALRASQSFRLRIRLALAKLQPRTAIARGIRDRL